MLATLGLHCQRLSRQFQKALDTLREIQSDRRQEEERHLKQAAALLELHKHKGIPYDPAQYGFVFSKAQRVRRAPRRTRVLPHAANCQRRQRPLGTPCAGLTRPPSPCLALSSIMESMKLFVPLLVLGSSGVFALVLAAADSAVVEEIVAKCNGDIITRGDLDRSRRELIETLRASGVVGDQLEKELGDREKNLLRDRIDQLILAQKAKDLNINVDTDVSKQLASIQSDSKIPDPEKFQSYIKEQSGMPYEDFKQEMKTRALTQHVIREEVTEKMSVKHEDIEKYYNEHKTEFVREERIFLQEILLSTEGKDAAGVAAAEKKAKDLVARARKGERFAEMARDNSDSVSAKGMGELPPYKKDVLSKNLEDLVWSQPKGYITDPVRTPNGFLILRVEDHQKAGQAELAEVESQINEKLLAPRLDAAVRDYLTKLRKDAFLEIKADYIDTGAAGGKDTAWVDPAQLRPETVKKEEVESHVRHKRLLWSIPVPGTQTVATSSSGQ
jgi:peptidyl-prolyl cis-trans isomerase SurA